MAISETVSPKRRITTAITTVERTSASLDLAPADTVSDVPDIEPPTGIVWNTPAATLAAPWPRKSRDASGYVPSGLGKLAVMLAPCTRPTNASESAGVSSAGTSPSSGQVGLGNELGCLRCPPTERRRLIRTSRRRPSWAVNVMRAIRISGSVSQSVAGDLDQPAGQPLRGTQDASAAMRDEWYGSPGRRRPPWAPRGMRPPDPRRWRRW
jgi:hypothetical protein